MRRLAATAVAIVTSLWVAQAQGAPIATRAALNALLGGNAVTEDFEAYNVAPFSFDTSATCTTPHPRPTARARDWCAGHLVHAAGQ